MNEDFNFDPLASMGVVPDSAGSNESLQRTDEWKQERCGIFTASRFKDLMSCKSRAKGKRWDDVNWILDFGDTAISYIIEKAVERATGQPIETAETWQMRWGNHYEPEGKAVFVEKYKHVLYKFDTELKEVGFIKFLKCAGASPDGVYGKEPHLNAFELKCPATVLSHYKLSTTPVDESHDYFWQVTGEMLALKTDKATFCSYDPRYPENFRLNTQFVKLSEIHASALKARIIVADYIVKTLIDDFSLDVRGMLSISKELIPTDYAEFVEWLKEAEKDYMV